MASVAEVLRDKGSEVHAIEPTATVYDAVEKMVARNVGALLVVDGDVPVGIITERDYLRHVVLEGRTSRETSVHEIMAKHVVCVDMECSLDKCMALMTERRVRHVVVVSKGLVAGIVSIGDAVKRLVVDQRVEIQYLTDYIRGYPAV